MATIRDSMSNVSHTDQCAIIQELCSLILKAQLLELLLNSLKECTFFKGMTSVTWSKWITKTLLRLSKLALWPTCFITMHIHSTVSQPQQGPMVVFDHFKACRTGNGVPVVCVWRKPNRSGPVLLLEHEEKKSERSCEYERVYQTRNE